MGPMGRIYLLLTVVSIRNIPEPPRHRWERIYLAVQKSLGDNRHPSRPKSTASDPTRLKFLFAASDLRFPNPASLPCFPGYFLSLSIWSFLTTHAASVLVLVLFLVTPRILPFPSELNTFTLLPPPHRVLYIHIVATHLRLPSNTPQPTRPFAVISKAA